MAKKSKIGSINPRQIARGKVEAFKQDTFAFIWLLFFVVLAVITVYFNSYVREMINISVLFMIFWYLEPLMFGVTGTTATTLLSRGKHVPDWKRFPLFFLTIILVYVFYDGGLLLLDLAFPEEHVNIIFIFMWVSMLFMLWVYRFSKEIKEDWHTL